VRQKLFMKRKGVKFMMRRWLGIVGAVPRTVYVVLVVSFLLLSGTSAFAVHKGAGGLTCGMCHTIHNSQGSGTFVSQSPGALVMLRAEVSGRQDIHKLCLQCHASNGNNAGITFEPHATIKSPKVYIDGAGGTGIAVTNTDPFDFTQIGAGGDFSGVFSYNGSDISYGTTPGDDPSGSNLSLGKGHSLGAMSVTPPGGGGTLTAFSCTSCHDPHGRNVTQGSSNGVNLYRMLRYNTASAVIAPMTNSITGMGSWVGGISGESGTGNYAGPNSGAANHVWPVYNTADQQNVYAAGSVKGDQSSGTAFSNFCAQCHQNWHESISATNVSGDDWKRHPVDNLITDSSPNSGAGVEITRFDNYNTNPFPSPLALNTTIGATKLPVMQDAGGTTYYADNSADRVFCLSCHYAHGGPNNDILRWNYTSNVSAGAQTGNAVATNVGCQQCHNR
jgi:hypothetical protein